MTEPTSHPQTDRIDTLLPVLADRERRVILTHLRDTTRELVSFEELTTVLSNHTDHDQSHTRTRLHHCHIPKLAEATAITYDEANNTIQYQGNSELESLLDTIRQHETVSIPTRPTTDS